MRVRNKHFRKGCVLFLILTVLSAVAYLIAGHFQEGIIAVVSAILFLLSIVFSFLDDSENRVVLSASIALLLSFDLLLNACGLSVIPLVLLSLFPALVFKSVNMRYASLWCAASEILVILYFVVPGWKTFSSDYPLITNIAYTVIYSMIVIVFFVSAYINRKETVQQNQYIDTLKQEVEVERQRVSDVKIQTVRAISNAVDARDKSTQHHSERVAQYSVMLAQKLGWSDEKLQRIETMALLHDIGKVGVQDSILLSNKSLSHEEYESIKQHTLIGGEILKDFTLIPYASIGAVSHHERWDGQGYPYGLKGTQIPIEARIICIADAFDAMNSNRVYRGRMTNNGIIKELIKGSGKQFDPELLDIFLPVAWKVLDSSEMNSIIEQ